VGALLSAAYQFSLDTRGKSRGGLKEVAQVSSKGREVLISGKERSLPKGSFVPFLKSVKQVTVFTLSRGIVFVQASFNRWGIRYDERQASQPKTACDRCE